jgi:tetratricopeptide (TPR) repeat protein
MSASRAALAILLFSSPFALAGPADEPIRRALAAVDAVESKEDQAYFLSRLARSQVKLGDPEGARATFKKAAEIGATVGGDRAKYQHHILLWIARDQLKVQDNEGARAALRRADEIARAMQSDNRKVVVAGAIIGHQLDAGDRDGARATYEWAIKVARTSDDPFIAGFRPKTIAGLQAALRDFDAALETARAVDIPGRPDQADGEREQCLFLIAYQLRPGIRDGKRIVKDALEIAYAIINPVHRDQAVAPLAEAQARLGDLDGALETLLSINDANRRCMTLDRILMDRAKAKDREAVRRLARRLREDADGIDNEGQRGALLTQVAVALVGVGDAEEGTRIVDRPGLRDRLETRVQLGHAREQAGDRDGARADWKRGVELAEERLRQVQQARGERDPEGSMGLAMQHILTCRAGLGDLDGCRKVAAEVFALDPNDISFGARLHKENAAAIVAAAIADSGDVPGALDWADARQTPKQRMAAALAVVDAIARRWGDKRP